MTDKIARVCDYCGKVDILAWHAESNGMLLFEGNGYFLFMRDVEVRESSRPSFTLTDTSFCPECLVKAITKWVKEVK